MRATCYQTEQIIIAAIISDQTTLTYCAVHPTMIVALASTQPPLKSKQSTVHLMGLKINHNQTKANRVNQLLVESILQDPDKKEGRQSFGSDMHLVRYKSNLVRCAASEDLLHPLQ